MNPYLECYIVFSFLQSINMKRSYASGHQKRESRKKKEEDAVSNSRPITLYCSPGDNSDDKLSTSSTSMFIPPQIISEMAELSLPKLRQRFKHVRKIQWRSSLHKEDQPIGIQLQVVAWMLYHFLELCSVCTTFFPRLHIAGICLWSQRIHHMLSNRSRRRDGLQGMMQSEL